jgi:hypothetical protein
MFVFRFLRAKSHIQPVNSVWAVHSSAVYRKMVGATLGR